MGYHTVSVVIPAYNAGRFILEALESVFRQTYPVAQIIVIDDGSTDNTKELVDKEQGRVTYVFQANAGPGSARNRGIRLSQSEWIAFLDSDDCWEANHIEHLMERARRYEEAALIYSGKRWMDIHGKLMMDIPLQTTFPSGWIFKNLFHANYISSTSVVMARRKVLIDVGFFDEHFRHIAEDYDLWLRIAAIAPVIGVPEHTVLYRRHDNNLTHQTAKQIKADLEVLQKARSMITCGAVDKRNNPDSIEIRSRMKAFYTEAAVGLFTIGAYQQMRSLGIDAMMQRCLTSELFVRWLLCLFPARLTMAVRDLRRTLRNHSGTNVGIPL